MRRCRREVGEGAAQVFRTLCFLITEDRQQVNYRQLADLWTQLSFLGAHGDRAGPLCGPLGEGGGVGGCSLDSVALPLQSL